MSKALIKCPSCEKEVSKSAKVCPNCGKKLKMGIFLKAIIALVAIGVLAAVFGPSQEEKVKQLADELAAIASAPASSLSPTGELAQIFKLGSKHTDIQREKKEKEITNQIVQWSLPVYEVNISGEKYRIQTSGNQAIMGGTPTVGAFIDLYPRSDEERQYIENLKTDDVISFKGKITGTSMRNIMIDPGILYK